MNKSRLFSKITAMALVAVMACCMAASAYYESLPTVLEGSDGKRYIGTTILYEDGTNRFRGSAWVQTEDSSRVPLGTIGCRSGLAYGDSGQIFCETDWVWNPSTDYFKSSVTPQQYSNRSVFAVGWGKIDRELSVRLEDSPTRGNARSVAVANLLDTLTEDQAYPANDAGETYGSVLLADFVGEDPDLLAAVHQDGVSGYIRSDDYTDTTTNSIPLYDQEGNVIGSFQLMESEEINTDAADIESVKAAAEQIYRQ